MAPAAETPAQVAGARPTASRATFAGRRLSATRELDITKYYYYPMARSNCSTVGHEPQLNSTYSSEQLTSGALLMMQHPKQQPEGHVIAKQSIKQHQTISVITSKAVAATANASCCLGKQQAAPKTTSDNLSLNSTSSSSQSLESSFMAASQSVGPLPVTSVSSRGQYEMNRRQAKVSMLSPPATQRFSSALQQIDQPPNFIQDKMIPRDKSNQSNHLSTTTNTTATTVGSNELPLVGKSLQMSGHSGLLNQVQQPATKPTIEEQLRLLFNPNVTTAPSAEKIQRQQHGTPKQGPLTQSWQQTTQKWTSSQHPPNAGLSSQICLNVRLSQMNQRSNLDVQQQQQRYHNQTAVEVHMNQMSHRLQRPAAEGFHEQQQQQFLGDEHEMMLFMLTSRRAAALSNTPADKEARILQWIHDCNRARLAPERPAAEMQ